MATIYVEVAISEGEGTLCSHEIIDGECPEEFGEIIPSPGQTVVMELRTREEAIAFHAMHDGLRAV